MVLLCRMEEDASAFLGISPNQQLSTRRSTALRKRTHSWKNFKYLLRISQKFYSVCVLLESFCSILRYICCPLDDKKADASFIVLLGMMGLMAMLSLDIIEICSFG